jgi:hypothetical protein
MFYVVLLIRGAAVSADRQASHRMGIEAKRQSALANWSEANRKALTNKVQLLSFDAPYFIITFDTVLPD